MSIFTPPITLHFFRAPISSNHAQWNKIFRAKHGPKKGKLISRRVPTHHTRKFNEYITDMVHRQVLRLDQPLREEIARCRFYIVRYIFQDRFMGLKDPTMPIVKDVTNLLKSTEDAIMKALGANDKSVFHNLLHKSHIPREEHARFIVTIWGTNRMPELAEVIDLLVQDAKDVGLREKDVPSLRLLL